MTSYKVDDNNVRLDSFVVDQLPRLSRAFIQRLIKEEKVSVNGSPSKPGHKLVVGDAVSVNYDMSELDNMPVVDLPIIFEDENCLVIDKPIGILSHSRGSIDNEATVSNFVRDRVPTLTGQRGGIVHRLDRSTSGLMICAKNPEAMRWLQKQFADRKVAKTYIALVEGTPEAPEAIIDIPIGRNPKQPALFKASQRGKTAQTHYKVIASSDKRSLILLTPKTGRTHQLRVHLNHIGHPILGDTFYGGSPADRLYLHALNLEITLPDKVGICFRTDLPKSFYEELNK